jgi:small subunit ribosomal protein S2
MTDNKSITIKECLDNDVCYGHLTKRWNPKMKDYILCKKNDIHIIDARKTVRQLNIACEKISNIISKGGNILFVCTKKQFSNYIQEVAESTKMPYVTNKWPCGLLTNYNTTLKTIKNINDIGEKLDSGIFKKNQKRIKKMLYVILKNLKRFLVEF